MIYDITISTWIDNNIKKTVSGSRILVLICADEKDAGIFLEALKSNPYTIKTAFTAKQHYKIGIFLQDNLTGIEIPKTHYQYKEFKYLIEGRISLVTTGYYNSDKLLSLNNPIKIPSGQMN